MEVLPNDDQQRAPGIPSADDLAAWQRCERCALARDWAAQTQIGG
jgi:hypothetical protein